MHYSFGEVMAWAQTKKTLRPHLDGIPRIVEGRGIKANQAEQRATRTIGIGIALPATLECSHDEIDRLTLEGRHRDERIRHLEAELAESRKGHGQLAADA